MPEEQVGSDACGDQGRTQNGSGSLPSVEQGAVRSVPAGISDLDARSLEFQTDGFPAISSRRRQLCRCSHGEGSYSPGIGYSIGIALALAVAVFARAAGFDRDRVFYPTVVIVVASYYVLFAVMGQWAQAVIVESIVMALFVALAVLGFKRYPWVTVCALAGHGLFDSVHDRLILNPGVPAWWPSFCLAYDLTAAGFLGLLFIITPKLSQALGPELAAKPGGLALKVPPVGIVLIVAALMLSVSLGLPQFAFAVPFRSVVAAAEALIGVLVGVLSVASFRRAHTTVNPMEPSSASSLVESGIYRLSRNPMYLGLLLVLMGWGTFLANMLSWMWIPIFVGYMNTFQIVPEEHALASRFGEEFAIYKSKVRRWI